MKTTKPKSKKHWKQKIKRKNARFLDKRKKQEENLISASKNSKRRYVILDDASGMFVKIDSFDSYRYTLTDKQPDGKNIWSVSEFIKRNGSKGKFRPIRVKSK
jgi:hypothetical protein